MNEMNFDEFAFFNQQLASMLREGIPLEGGLRQLSAGMGAGPLRGEIERLEADLARGTSMKEALAARDLPLFYTRMMLLGSRSNDLPGVLTLLADYYQRANALWTRLKGLIVYPLLVIAVSLALTLLLTIVFGRFFSNFAQGLGQGSGVNPARLVPLMWLPPLLLGLAAVCALAGLSLPAFRGWLRWKLPAFREASLAQLGGAMSLMLKNGTTLSEALAMAEELEAGTPAAGVLARWRSQLQSGEGKPGAWTAHSPVPPLFLWFVQNSGEDVAAGFQKAADSYRDRASYKIEMALYGALPLSILILGLMVLWQAMPLLRTIIVLMNSMGDMN